MKFYGFESMEEQFSQLNERTWLADIKLTNTGDSISEINGGGFWIVDQFDYPYATEQSSSWKLLPGESMRTTIEFSGISKLSRPMYLIYAPTDLRMDISAWT
jgi:hypothetical protein